MFTLSTGIEPQTLVLFKGGINVKVVGLPTSCSVYIAKMVGNKIKTVIQEM